MNRDSLLEIFDRQQRRELVTPGVERQVSGQVIRHLDHQARRGFVIYSTMDGATADQQIDEQVAFFQNLGYDFEWKLYDYDTPSDLRQRLAARGFEIEEPEALVVLDSENAPSFFTSVDTSMVQRVHDPAGIDQIVEMENAVWGDPHEELGEWLKHDLAEHPELLSIYVIPAGGRIASAAWVYFHPPTQFASLWGGSTLPEYRKRGYYTALLVTRMREAQQRGFRFLTVDASPMSRPILEKHGFQFLCFSTPCQWKVEFNAR